jgi:hypothetical protein
MVTRSAGFGTYVFCFALLCSPVCFPMTVMLGRGGESNHHRYVLLADLLTGCICQFLIVSICVPAVCWNQSGNITFRHLAGTFKARYQEASRQYKPQIAMEVVLEWRALDPPGRFLARTDVSETLVQGQ